jgi:hypothetical protein
MCDMLCGIGVKINTQESSISPGQEGVIGSCIHNHGDGYPLLSVLASHQDVGNRAIDYSK